MRSPASTQALADSERGLGAEAPEREALYERIGELLFSCVALARAVDVDPEIALRRAAERFRERAGSSA